MEYRKFYIQNDAGEQWGLQGERGIYFVGPSGLGLQNKNLTADLGHGFFKKLDAFSFPAQPVAGELVFLPPAAYQVYREFVRWISAASQLLLLYRPYGTDTFQAIGSVDYLRKSELEGPRILRCAFQFTPQTPWYKPQTMDLVMQDAAENAMKYPFTYDADLTYGSDLVGSWAVKITPAGMIPASLSFSFSGAATDPILTLTGQNTNTEYGRCAITGEITGLEFSSLYTDSYVRDGSGADLMDDVDPAYDPFFRVPLTEPCILRLQASNTLAGSASVSVNYFYRSV